VVVLPEPVGPVTSKMPCGRWISFNRRNSSCASMPRWRKSSRPSRLSSSRSTTRSPWPVGRVETRTSTGRPATLSEIRPSCGRRFSAMSRWAMTLTRETSSGPKRPWRLQGLAQHAVHPKPHQQPIFERFDVDIRSVFLDRPGQQRVDQTDDRRVIGAFQQILRLGQALRHLFEIHFIAEILHHPRRAVAVAFVAVLQHPLEMFAGTSTGRKGVFRKRRNSVRLRVPMPWPAGDGDPAILFVHHQHAMTLGKRIGNKCCRTVSPASSRQGFTHV
jgi:hypothetical protein